LFSGGSLSYRLTAITSARQVNRGIAYATDNVWHPLGRPLAKIAAAHSTHQSDKRYLQHILRIGLAGRTLSGIEQQAVAVHSQPRSPIRVTP
jgi:hypothetical protein